MKRLLVSPEVFLLLAVLVALRREEELLVALISMLFHEVGHILAVFSLNLPIYRGRITPFGLKIYYEDGMAGKEETLLVLLAGPIANLGTACYLLASGKNEAAVAGLALGVYNLLPLEGLDGGECVKLLFPQKGKGLIRISSGIAMGLMLFLFGVGLCGGEINLYVGLIALAMTFKVLKKSPSEK